MSGKVLVLAAGGTGGHMFPAQALAEEMISSGWQVKLSTDLRGARYANNFPSDVDVSIIKSATFSGASIIRTVLVPTIIFYGVLQSVLWFRSNRPVCIVGFGGYPSIPAVLAALILRIPTILHEQNGVLGRVNKLFAKRVDFVAFGILPENSTIKNARYIGNPVRSSVLKFKETPYIPPGDYPINILVIGGSQGARIMSDIVPVALSSLSEKDKKKNLRVTHQARPEDKERVVELYSEGNIRAEVSSFFDDVARRISEAQLVISRSGASSIADIATIGRPSILVPLKSALRDEQSANALSMTSVNSAISLIEDDFTVEKLASCISKFLSSPKKAKAMATAALERSSKNSVTLLSELIINLVKQKKNGWTPTSVPIKKGTLE
jgi:UDP-N-acetylglucosamine--N-acetylmuramyl-(pentapeptide) pyrophosphoryl-undecaprenol N-acetylglucosamine transferase